MTGDQSRPTEPPTRCGSDVTAPETVASPVLAFHHVTRWFGRTCAVEGASLDIVGGRIHGLVGENGAGKSTLIGIATASVHPSGGFVSVDGEVLERPTPRLIQERGTAVVRQHPALFPDLSIAENIWLEAPARLRPPRRRLVAWAQDLLDGGIARGISAAAGAASLSVESAYAVELAIALVREPRVLFLDEPTEHLGPELVDALFDRLRWLAASGTAVLYVSHRLHDVKNLSDIITVMRDGRVIGTFDADQLELDQQDEYIAGRPVGAIFPPRSDSSPDAATVLKAVQLSGSGFQDVSLAVLGQSLVIRHSHALDHLRDGHCPQQGSIPFRIVAR